jgi:hypothetical protein
LMFYYICKLDTVHECNVPLLSEILFVKLLCLNQKVHVFCWFLFNHQLFNYCIKPDSFDPGMSNCTCLKGGTNLK